MSSTPTTHDACLRQARKILEEAALETAPAAIAAIATHTYRMMFATFTPTAGTDHAKTILVRAPNRTVATALFLHHTQQDVQEMILKTLMTDRLNDITHAQTRNGAITREEIDAKVSETHWTGYGEWWTVEIPDYAPKAVDH